MISDKIKTYYTQFIKFGMVGVSNTAISLAVYYVLIHFGIHYLLANASGFVVSVINSYFWNSHFVFKNKTEKNEFHAFLKVFTSYGISFCISCVLMIILVQIIGIDKRIAPIIRLGLTIPLNFIMNKLWAFKDK